MFIRKYWVPVTVFIIAMGGIAVYYLQTRPPQEPIKIYKPVEVEKPKTEVPVGDTSQGGHWHGDEWHAEPHETEKLPLVDASDAHNQVPVIQKKEYPPLPPSSVPDNIPEHLKLPEEWKGGYYYGFSEGPEPMSMDDSLRAVNIFREIIRDYNPRRPIGDIWHQFIEYEKMYRAYAEQDLGRTPFAALTAQRVDWQYEQTWAFPEIMEIVVGDSSEDEKSILFNARLIAMGEQEPNWNEHIMRDGRAFYVRDDTRYEFEYGTPDKGSRIGFSRTVNPKEVVVIYPDKTSDEELKRLGWWNFHINPYTLEPVDYQPYNLR